MSTPTSWILDLATEQGPARWTISAPHPRAELGAAEHSVLLLGHGAGGGIEAPDLVGLAQGLPAHGFVVARFEQPWRVAGKKVAARPTRLDEAWLEGVAALGDLLAGRRLLLGGRSAGARVACRTADQLGAAGVVALAFPLKPPGDRPSRAAELNQPSCPVLVLQGSKDPFGSPDQMREASGPGIVVVEVEGATHALTVAASRRSSADQAAFFVDTVLRFSQALADGGED